jgi:hypothetical protein
MADSMLSYLTKKIDEELRVIEEDTAMGKAADFGAYKYSCGVYRGLLIAKGLLAELAERMEQDDE